jgi:hypothetical protein
MSPYCSQRLAQVERVLRTNQANRKALQERECYLAPNFGRGAVSALSEYHQELPVLQCLGDLEASGDTPWSV